MSVRVLGYRWSSKVLRPHDVAAGGDLHQEVGSGLGRLLPLVAAHPRGPAGIDSHAGDAVVVAAELVEPEPFPGAAVSGDDDILPACHSVHRLPRERRSRRAEKGDGPVGSYGDSVDVRRLDAGDPGKGTS